jgi:hypothetical protein
MPESPEHDVSTGQGSAAQHLTADITRTLKFSAQVTPQQHLAAKERLLRLAAAQMSPEAVAPRRSSLLEHAAAVCHSNLLEHAAALRPHVASVMHFLFFESDPYERARRFPPHYRHYNVHGHYAYTIIQMSA